MAATDTRPEHLHRSSIDLSLELERQLESESVPNSPRAPTHGRGSSIDNNVEALNAHALDPQILAHIVMQLRDSLTTMTNERDDLVNQLGESHMRIAEFKDALALMTERCTTLEEDLEASKKKQQDDEEAISLLRSKVEESRRGLMRLQAERNNENKRMTLDLGHARSPSLRTSKGTFTPLTGSGAAGPPSSYRRSTAVNDSDPGFAEFVANLPGSPGQASFTTEPEPSPAPNRRRSFFGATARRSVSPSSLELDAVKKELATLKTALDETRMELTESNEAKEASESCVRALRDYISQMGATAPPTLLSNPPPEATSSKTQPAAGGWGFGKLWRVDTSASSLSQTSNTSNPGKTNQPQEIASPSTAVPLRNKFGAFFTRGTSISEPNESHRSPVDHQQEPILNGLSESETSSISEMEPVSPPNEGERTGVFIRAAEDRLQHSSLQDGVKHEVPV
ncbi:hypothetical protein M422DRAFT_41402 [Sphaerobolus stellatus SS14]|nr:hypothetical protein M422DRAFT_41402 [Sphaerobolus stellatus SS14]